MLTVSEIIQATGGRLIQGSDKITCRGISIDSRKCQPGDVYIAIKGDRLNGHKFIRQAVNEKKVPIVVVSEKVFSPKKVTVILVRDTTKALGDIAGFYRRKFDIPVIGITGSTGKTTVKEMISDVLSSKYNVLKNFKTENNHIGVPLTLLRLRRSHQVVVVEMGTNQPGDIRYLARLSEPTIAVYTNIGESHLEGLKSPEGVFKEKLDLVKFMRKNGTVIYNNDDHFLARFNRKKILQKKISFGITGGPRIKAKGLQCKSREQIFDVKNEKFSIRTPARHNVYNALAAISCAKLLHVGMTRVQQRLSGFKFPQGRLNIKDVHGLQIIDDTYNANPVSMKSAVMTLHSLPARGEKVLILGDMLELGRGSRKFHEQLGELIGASSVGRLYTIGKFSKYLLAKAKSKNPLLIGAHSKDISQLHEHLGRIRKPKNVFLVKGSRGMKMEQTVAFLTQKG